LVDISLKHIFVAAVVVSPDSTVADIKRSFQVIISAQEEKNLAARKISWFVFLHALAI
jgi:hypothetical protein